MRNMWFAGIAGMLLLALTGCRTGETVHGQSCYELTEGDKAELVELARASMQRPNRFITASETAKILKDQPTFKIYYTGDKSGEAKLTWLYPDKKVSVIFSGRFLEDDMQWKAEVVPIREDTIYVDRQKQAGTIDLNPTTSIPSKPMKRIKK